MRGRTDHSLCLPRRNRFPYLQIRPRISIDVGKIIFLRSLPISVDGRLGRKRMRPRREEATPGHPAQPRAVLP
jgi:hypothetical protein